MNPKVILFLALLAFSAFSAGAPDAATSAQLLQLHNQDRGDIGLSSLSWSADLASSAQEWANTLAADGGLSHSGTRGVGENLAKASFRYNLIDFLYGMWRAEKQYFDSSKPFPDCSTTGNWQDIAHYTQIIWAKTSQVGCGIANTTQSSVLVCHYKVAGNYREEYAYTSSDIVSGSGNDETETEVAEEAETTTPPETDNDDSNKENDNSQDDSNEENDNTSAGNSSDNSNDDNDGNDSVSAEASPKPTKKTYHYGKGYKKTYTRAFKNN